MSACVCVCLQSVSIARKNVFLLLKMLNQPSSKDLSQQILSLQQGLLAGRVQLRGDDSSSSPGLAAGDGELVPRLLL